MNNINNVTLSGNLTRDPELRMTPSQVAVMNFSIAVNESKKVDGEWTDYANFFDCVLIGKRAEALHKYMEKGKKVLIQAHAHQSRWADKQTGQNRSKVEFVVDNIELVGNGKNAPQNGSEAAQNMQEEFGGVELYDDVLPF